MNNNIIELYKDNPKVINWDYLNTNSSEFLDEDEMKIVIKDISIRSILETRKISQEFQEWITDYILEKIKSNKNSSNSNKFYNLKQLIDIDDYSIDNINKIIDMLKENKENLSLNELDLIKFILTNYVYADTIFKDIEYLNYSEMYMIALNNKIDYDEYKTLVLSKYRVKHKNYIIDEMRKDFSLELMDRFITCVVDDNYRIRNSEKNREEIVTRSLFGLMSSANTPNIKDSNKSLKYIRKYWPYVNTSDFNKSDLYLCYKTMLNNILDDNSLTLRDIIDIFGENSLIISIIDGKIIQNFNEDELLNEYISLQIDSINHNSSLFSRDMYSMYSMYRRRSETYASASMYYSDMDLYLENLNDETINKLLQVMKNNQNSGNTHIIPFIDNTNKSKNIKKLINKLYDNGMIDDYFNNLSINSFYQTIKLIQSNVKSGKDYHVIMDNLVMKITVKLLKQSVKKIPSYNIAMHNRRKTSSEILSNIIKHIDDKYINHLEKLKLYLDMV
jgi:hypothetical protein